MPEGYDPPIDPITGEPVVLDPATRVAAPDLAPPTVGIDPSPYSRYYPPSRPSAEGNPR